MTSSLSKNTNTTTFSPPLGLIASGLIGLSFVTPLPSSAISLTHEQNETRVPKEFEKHSFRITTHQQLTKAPTVSDRESAILLDKVKWIETQINASRMASAHLRINHLARHVDGWKGPDSVKASEEAIDAAKTLLQKISVHKRIPVPKVGLDSEGAFTFYWRNAVSSAVLDIFDDGTYSLFASKGSSTLSFDSEQVNKAFSDELIEFLES